MSPSAAAASRHCRQRPAVDLRSPPLEATALLLPRAPYSGPPAPAVDPRTPPLRPLPQPASAAAGCRCLQQDPPCCGRICHRGRASRSAPQEARTGLHGRRARSAGPALWAPGRKARTVGTGKEGAWPVLNGASQSFSTRRRRETERGEERGGRGRLLWLQGEGGVEVI
jgi:hypothetical protein